MLTATLCAFRQARRRVIDRKSFSQAFEGSRAALPDLQQRIATAIEKGAQLT